MNMKSFLPIFGEVLFDHFPDVSRVLGGAPFNVAWHLQAFGLSPQFISRIGSDTDGDEILQLMSDWDMSREQVQIDSEHPTGSVKVAFQNGEPQYDIVNDSAYDFIASDLLRIESSKGVLYHGSLAIRNPIAHNALQTLKSRHHGKIFMDVNLRSPWWRQETLFELLLDAHWVKLNRDELDILIPNQPDLHSAMQMFYKQFDLETLVITLGEQGAIALDNQQQFVTTQPGSQVSVVDTVGAGDAFSAILLWGLIQNWLLKDTLEKAQIFASAIVGVRGAIVADKNFYREISQQMGL